MGAVPEGAPLIIGSTNGTVVTGAAATDPKLIVGKCTHPGGVGGGMLVANTLIGGGTYFLGRARIY
jgi:hypothetical protein